MPRIPPRPRVALLTLLVVALLCGLPGVPLPAASAVIYPLEHGQSVADPAIVQARPDRYVVVGTGPQVVRATSGDGTGWQVVDSALLTRPAWANPDPALDVWASDMVRLRGRWLLYYAVPVTGLAPSTRCIGVATARKPTGTFRPAGSRPLVCPPGTDAPAAQDPVLDPGRTTPTLPTIGAIDPSVYVDAGGVRLLYKTDGRPSSIRMVPLTANGLDVAGASRQLLASSGVVENPALVKRGRWYYLFLSVGDYSRCSYATVYRRSRRLMAWTQARQHPFLTAASTNLCGPGGADVLVRGTGERPEVDLYFHAWVCDGTGLPCQEPFHSYRGAEDHRRPVRALYGIHVSFTDRNVPRPGKWIRRRR